MKFNNDISKIIAALCDADMRTTNKDIKQLADIVSIETIEKMMNK